MNITKYILNSALALASVVSLCACSDDDELGPSIFPDVPTEPDPSSYSYKFDSWLNRNFRDKYNLDFKYKLEDVEIDMQYNLVPASMLKSEQLAVLTRYLWFDAYGELSSEEFLKQYGPRIIHLIGSPAYNPSNGTETLGLAEGGLKVSLFKVNEMLEYDINMLNEYYFRTMHHEFGHIMHQTKSYPVEFNNLSQKFYDATNWQNQDLGQMASLGFITNYASGQPREDFAETIANYVTRTDEQLNFIMWLASLGWTTGVEKSEDEGNSDDDLPYYPYYVFLNDQDRMDQNRTYFYATVDRPYIAKGTLVNGEPYNPVDRNGNELSGATLYKVGVYDQINNQYFTDAEAAQAHLTELEAQYGEVFAVPDVDNVKGDEVIRQKQSIVRNWYKDVWNLDFDKLREIVQRRQFDFDLPALLNEIESIE